MQLTKEDKEWIEKERKMILGEIQMEDEYEHIKIIWVKRRP